MFYSSIKSSQKYFHTAECGYRKQIGASNIQTFISAYTAKTNGYVPCPHCSPIGRQYSMDRKSIDAFCDHYGFRHFFHNGELYVISAGDTSWRICSTGLNGSAGNYLLHESKCGVPYNRKATAYVDRQYHLQHVRATSLLGYMVYILNHDVFEKEREETIKLERERIAWELEEKMRIEHEEREKEINRIRAVKRQIGRQNFRKHGCKEEYVQKRRRSNQQLRELTAAIRDYSSAKAACL